MILDVPANLMATGNRGLIRRAVEHLMLGAIAAMPKGGSLWATSAAGPDAVELEIADTGPTLSDEARRHAFDSARRHRARRLGLGVGHGAPHRQDSRRQRHGRQLSRRRRRLHLANPTPRRLGGRRIMDVLRRAYSQLHDRFRSMTPGSRLMAAMLAAALLVGLGYLGTQQIARPDTDLMHGVPVANSRLPLMEAAFGKAKLKGLSRFAGRRSSCRADKRRSTWRRSSPPTPCRRV